MSGLNGIVWVFSFVLAVVFLVTGLLQAYRYETARARFAWVEDMPQGLVQIIGLVQVLCAVGLILPPIIGVYPWLSAVAASMLALMMLLAIGLNARRKDTDAIAPNVLLLILALVVFYGRLALVQ